MRMSQLTAEFASDIETVWDAVTDNSNYDWRSDLERIEVSEDGGSFTEYTKGGFSTHFTIWIPRIRWKEECPTATPENLLMYSWLWDAHRPGSLESRPGEMGFFKFVPFCSCTLLEFLV